MHYSALVFPITIAFRATAAHDIETGKSPFTNINTLLISHIHPDHFDLPSTVRFLKSHPATIVVAPGQVSEKIREALAGDSRALSQVHTATLKENSITTHDEGWSSGRRLSFGARQHPECGLPDPSQRTNSAAYWRCRYSDEGACSIRALASTHRFSVHSFLAVDGGPQARTN
jgi:ribonuclease BN (tRNA processing enzyme)